MPRLLATAWLLLLALGSGTALPAGAGDLRLESVSLTLRPDDAATTLWLDNTGPVPLRARVRVFAWTQDGGGEVLAPTGELAISPPVIVIPPHGRQLVRVVRVGDPVPAVETAYRLIIDDLPGNSAPAEPRVLRYSIPIFLPPSAPSSGYRLQARIEQDASGHRWLSLENQGDRHARIARLAVAGRDGPRHLLAPGLAGYVLAGRYKRWPLPADLPPASAGLVQADVNGRPEDIQVLETALLTGP